MPDSKERLERKFIQYDSENPDVYKLFKQYALEVIRRGYDRFSAKAIFERIRWHMQVETYGDTFKINNNYTPFYARKLMEEDSMFDGFFETRSQGNRHE